VLDSGEDLFFERTASRKLVDLIELNADELTASYVEDIRRLLWAKVQAAGLLDTALDLYQAMDLQHRVLIFFDRAIYHAAVGYEEKS
jgi:hypothetical protein